ncbi:MAG: hypothetical protein ACM3WU_05100 [Bacillota bacterium]
MDRHELERLGDQLHGIGHRRRELAQKVLAEATDGDPRRSRELYQELADVTTQAIELMQKQRDILRKEISRIEA